ncbi:radical S-adenosyl methionine domain-containing protein 1, mitochondrial isoform X3 [Rattus norvegicus]|uniref:radical S-adenosyl methionine domain-containing protein 1, mitochondrial isoform X3 n=1 Tax=Rattus norvegicus TaxID=10116 RepID=UPI002FD83C8A
MVPSGVRTGRWVAAARAAQRRPRVDSLGQPPSPESARTRAALYVHGGVCVLWWGNPESGQSPHCSCYPGGRGTGSLPACRFGSHVGGQPHFSPRSQAGSFWSSRSEQSLDDAELQLLGRTHSAREALQTLTEARHLFPGRVSVDLMLGLPAQKVQQGTLPAPDPDLAAEMYQEGRTVLRDAGFRQYEVSNFARNGALSNHNWTYWQCGQYLGIGPGAHGQFVPQGAGGHTREARIQTLEPDNWMKEVMLFGHGTRKCVPLSELELLEEVLAMGLRTDVGVTHQHWRQFEPQLTLWDVFGASREVKELLEQGLLLLDHRGLRCSWEGLAVLDSLLLTLLPQLQEAWQHRTPSPESGG